MGEWVGVGTNIGKIKNLSSQLGTELTTLRGYALCFLFCVCLCDSPLATCGLLGYCGTFVLLQLGLEKTQKLVVRDYAKVVI